MIIEKYLDSKIIRKLYLFNGISGKCLPSKNNANELPTATIKTEIPSKMLFLDINKIPKTTLEKDVRDPQNPVINPAFKCGVLN